LYTTMIYIKDEGSTFDATLDDVCKYVQAFEEHGGIHHDPFTEIKSLSESSMELSWTNDMMGTPVKVKTRVTTILPLGVAVEIIDGPMAGSKFFNIYTPKGNKTDVSVIGEFDSKSIPQAQLERNVLAFLENIFNEDNAAMKAMQVANR
jgi:hypothetical protein